MQTMTTAESINFIWLECLADESGDHTHCEECAKPISVHHQRCYQCELAAPRTGRSR